MNRNLFCPALLYIPSVYLGDRARLPFDWVITYACGRAIFYKADEMLLFILTT
jgi:hypothetical protein